MSKQTIGDMTEEDFEEVLEAAMDNFVDPDPEGEEPFKKVTTFAEAALLTSDRGLVIRLHTGEEFQLTIKRSR